ncbi:nucleotidyl transferase AbiEii/AbiGii toxin family protein [Emticicia sp. C21]|uniref:nucleotidyl transferase AbiEii/AbiGii toxin family protein n=1 Tax=Emticicia sp. C21 TaxID=2302915 RepID=UPI000E35140A|nr:nucleotidyl transferase AbiEii/AbiGii toxin family protein [Emticicia sp. C21]RFS17857.1 hypothetical protein D0T08_01010 [Emticicia sp. C21]
MEREEYARLLMIAQEAFIRRASAVDHPFMLKGSFVTRQYFPKGVLRIPADLDWVYLQPIHDDETARQIFDDWLITITEKKENDGVEFRSFTLNQFWRRIDYAMSDDFPTVNTDLLCWVEGEEIQLFIDLSFNLDLESLPIPLKYEPISGESFIVPRTVPLNLQVSWKIHQTLVRPRFKDLFDLTYLVQNPEFTNETLALTLQALVNECSADNIDLKRLDFFLKYDLATFFTQENIRDSWAVWRFEKWNRKRDFTLIFGIAKYITDVSVLPENVNDFIDKFKSAMEKAGFGIHLIENLPKPTHKKRIPYAGQPAQVLINENKEKKKTEIEIKNRLLITDENKIPIEEKAIVKTKRSNSIFDSILKLFNK